MFLSDSTGPKANPSERKAALSAGEQFIKDKGYPKNTKVGKAALLKTFGEDTFHRVTPLPQIQVIPAGGEMTLFKQFFCDWKDKDETTGVTKPYTIGRIAKVPRIPFDASTLHANKTMAAHHGMVDDGKGKVQVRAR